jgi:hypothetical protein
MVSIEVGILRKRDPRDSVLLPSAVVYDTEGLVPFKLGCRKLFAHVKLRGGYNWKLLRWMTRNNQQAHARTRAALLYSHPDFSLVPSFTG